MLFCVTTRGRDSTFSKPRDSAMVRMASIRTVLLAFNKVKPLVGEVDPRFENNGIDDPVVPVVAGTVIYPGVRPFTEVGEEPACSLPPMALCPLPQPKPNWVPMSRL